MDIIAAALLLDFYNWLKNPILDSGAIGFSSGIVLFFVGSVFLGIRIERRPKARVKGVASYWSVNWRPLPVAKEARVQFWLTMIMMLAAGVGFLLAPLLRWVSTENFTTTSWAALLVLPLFLVGAPSWFMGNELVTMRRERSRLIKTLTARKDSCLSVLTEAYSALAYNESVKSKRAILETVRGQLRLLTQGEKSPEGREYGPLVWDEEIRKKVEAFFPIVAEGLDNSEMAAAYAEALKFVFLKDDAETLKSMRKTLVGPFDKAYPQFTYDSSASPFLFDCLVGLHEYDTTATVGYFSDALAGSPQMFQALVRSLSLDLLSNLKAKGVTPMLKIKLARKISEFEGKNQEALDRATQLVAML